MHDERESTREVETKIAQEVTTIETKSVKFKKKNILILCSTILLIIVAVATVFVININSSYGKFKHALQLQDFATAIALYEQGSSDVTFKNKAQTYLGQFIVDETNAYLDEKLAYRTVNDALKTILPYGEATAIQSALETIKVVEKSRNVYAIAEKSMDEENYERAISNYELVVKDDRKNYANAQKKVSEAKDLLCQKTIKKATEELEAHNAVAAFAIISEVPEEYQREDVQELLKKVAVQATSQIRDEIADYISSGDYKQACLVAFSVPNALLEDSIKTAKQQAMDGLSNQADEKSAKGDYDAAIALLTDNQGMIIDSSFSEKLKSLKKSKNIAQLKELKNGLQVKYDSFEKRYTFCYDDTLSRTVNMTADLTASSNTAVFAARFGFIADDWIFMNAITIDCDGIQHNINVDYFNRKTNVGSGGIAEVYSLVDSNSIINSINVSTTNFSQAMDFTSLIDSMSKAQKVMIRFSGSGGNKDAVLTQQQVTCMVSLWSIYEILKADSSLISYLL